MLERDHVGVALGVLFLAIQSFALHAPSATILIDATICDTRAPEHLSPQHGTSFQPLLDGRY